MDLYAQQLNANGDAQWTVNEKAICNATGSMDGFGMIPAIGGWCILLVDK